MAVPGAREGPSFRPSPPTRSEVQAASGTSPPHSPHGRRLGTGRKEVRWGRAWAEAAERRPAQDPSCAPQAWSHVHGGRDPALAPPARGGDTEEPGGAAALGGGILGVAGRLSGTVSPFRAVPDQEECSRLSFSSLALCPWPPLQTEPSLTCL